MKNTDLPGHQLLRQKGAQALQATIHKMQKSGKSISEIASELKLAKGHAVHYLYGRRGKKMLRKFCDETTIDCILVISEGLELLRNEMAQLKVKSYLGEAGMTVPDYGSLLRSMQKTLEIYQLIQKKGTQGLSPVPDEREDPRLLEVRRKVEEIFDGAAEDTDVVTELNPDEPRHRPT